MNKIHLNVGLAYYLNKQANSMLKYSYFVI